ncbi:MAG TPA: HAD family phosphatase [Firmicutes bacterium]|nr:HAD family phosphatase [Bacillota bacterium]
MAIKLVAMDIDDTLITDELTIPQKVREAIAAARAQGVKVVLATGRMLSSSVAFARELGLSEPLICYNGALIQGADDERPLVHHPVPLDLAREIVVVGKREGLHINAYIDEKMYVEELNKYTEFYSSFTKAVAHPVGDLLAFMDKPPTKLLYVCEAEIAEKWWLTLRERYRGKLEVFRSKPQYVEFTALGVSKGAALRELAELYGLEPEEVMAIGDSFNDIPMLEYAGIGVAVANAPEAVRSRADYVTLSNEEGGVAEAIYRFVLS